VVLDLPAVQVGGHRHRLSDAHVLELHFPEVGLHPQPLERHDGHERHAGRYALTQLHAAPGEVAGERRAHAGALQGEPRPLHHGSGRLHVRVVGDASAADQGGAGGEILLRGDQRIARRLQRIARVPHLFRRHRPGGGEILAAVEVRQRPIEVRAALRDDRRQLVAVGEHRAGLAHGARQLLLGVLQSDTGIGGVEPHQLLAGLHQVGLVGVDRDHRAIHLRHDADQVAGHVGVVRALVMARVQPPPGRGEQRHDENCHRHADEPGLAALPQRER